jgi:hypothetical protein
MNVRIRAGAWEPSRRRVEFKALTSGSGQSTKVEGHVRSDLADLCVTGIGPDG